MAVEFEVAEDHTEEAQDALKAAILRALERCGMQAEGYAKDLCPVDTGLLRNSITHAVSGQAAAVASYKDNEGKQSGTYSGAAPDTPDPCAYIGTNVDYGPDVELGTRKMAAQPFLKPAAADHAGTYRRIFEDELKNG